jgi:hypothetical protein
MIFRYSFYFCTKNISTEDISIVRYNANLNSPKKVSHLKKYGIYYFGCAGVLIIITIIITILHKRFTLKRQAVNTH